MSLDFTFWGVRGSLPCPGPSFVRYGGNTSCIEVVTEGCRIILDCGSGMRALGDKIMSERGGLDFRDCQAILLSHTHWDHIMGFPFFRPFYCRDLSFRVMAGHLTEDGGIRSALCRQMEAPFFPVSVDIFSASMEFIDFAVGSSFDLFDVCVRTVALNHPNGAVGYRLDCGGKSLCYVTDTEHFSDRLDSNILGLIEGSDAVIYDSAYTDSEYERKRGWGHSTWRAGLKLCEAAGVKRLYIFHHDPAHDDDFMDALAAEAVSVSELCVVAKEGMTVRL